MTGPPRPPDGTGNPVAAAWTAGILDTLRALRGSHVAAAAVREMAFSWGDDVYLFEHPKFAFVQAQVLELTLDGRFVWFSTWQDDDLFALQARPAQTGLLHDPRPSSPGWRERAMPEFPLGRVDDVAWHADGGGRIRDVSLRLGGRPVVLCAGEVEECEGGGALVRDFDESVLVFLDRTAYETTRFNVRI